MVILSDHDDSASISNASSLQRKRKRDTANASTDHIFDRYDVFLSFRGPDTRHGFTDHLYHRLIEANIPTFRDDDELEKGEPIKQQLEKAITESSISIIVFSEDYASSSWCLDELVRILEKRDHKVIPIFYHVDVSDVRYQKGSFEEAFKRHTEKGYVELEKIEAWKRALTKAAALSGFPLAKYKGGSETEFIGGIVREIENSKTWNVPGHLVGMDNELYLIDSWLKDRSKDSNVLLICGIPGIGKTTLAKYCFNKYYKYFQGSCFLASITAMWNKTGVCGFQSQLLWTIGNKREEIRIYNCDEGTQRIKKAICIRKVLVVLDDVSNTEQLEAFLGQEQRFNPGSKIIVTTTNQSLQNDFTIPPKVHIVECLYRGDSLKLFCWHAFRQLLPLEEYRQISEEILLRCGGLPLALVILGSSLRKKLDIVFWEKQLQKWDEIGNPDVHKVMQISYDSLEDETVKYLFLHVACFFVGEEEDYLVKILDLCGLHATVGIQNLIDRCLITRYESKLMMHTVIQDMGREIVRQECPDEPGRRSRLWYHEDSFTVLKYDKGSEFVQGLILDGQKINKVESERSSFATAAANPNFITRTLGKFLPSKEGELRLDAFAKMINLKLLKLNHVHLIGDSDKFPKELKWISWHGFPLEYVPMTLENLVVLDLQHSKLKQVWKRYMEVKSLRFLNLSFSLELRQTPDFRGLLQLESLILRGCSNLVKVCETIGILKGLVLLDLTDCKRLKDLPGLPESLSTLKLSGCLHLDKFPREPESVNPSNGYRIVNFLLPSISTGPVKLLAHLPHLLVNLSLEGCNLSDECFPRSFSGLSSLETLDLSGNLITKLPDCVRNLSNSRFSLLNITRCPQLLSVIHPPSTVIGMYLENKSYWKRIKIKPQHKFLLVTFDKVTIHIENEGCFKYIKAGNVERKILKNLGLESVSIGCMDRILYEFGIFSTHVQSTSIPHCFEIYFISYTDGADDSYKDGEDDSYIDRDSYKDGEDDSYIDSDSYKDGEDDSYRMAKLWYTVPSSVGRKIQGLNICLIKRDYSQFPIDVRVCNKTKDLAWTYDVHQHIPSKNYMWVSVWKCEDLFEPGDEIELSFKTFKPERNVVEECGIRIVYEEEEDLSNSRLLCGDRMEEEEKEEEEDLSNSRLLWSDRMEVSFSNYRTPGTHYLLLGLKTDDMLIAFNPELSRYKDTDGHEGMYSFHFAKTNYYERQLPPIVVGG